jgi:hypothetical protein
MRILALAAGALLLSGVLFGGSGVDAATTVKVTSNNLGVDWFDADTRPAGTGTFEAGPATPPIGAGSFELSTPDGSAKVQLFTNAFDGVRLADIDGIGYSTYRSSSPQGSPAVAALNLRVDLTGDGAPDTYMVFEPYHDQGNAALLDNVWQPWDAYRGGAAKWWLSSGAGGCGQATPCAWATILSSFPGATIEEGVNCGPGGVTVPCPGSAGINQGSGNAGVVSNVDAFYVSVSGDQTTYNLDLAVGPPTMRSDCKNGGWATFDTPREFKNQGDCVSFVNNGK